MCRVSWTAADGAQAGEDLQRLAQRRLVGGVVQGQRRLVRAAQAGPQPGRFLPLACHLQPVGPGQLTARRPGRTGAPQPGRDLAAVPSVRAGRYIIGQFGLLRGPVRLALQPARLGAGQPHRNDPLWLTGGVRGRRRLVEILPGTRLAAPGPDHAEHLQRVRPGHSGDRSALASSSVLSATASSQRPVRSRAAARCPRKKTVPEPRSCSSQ